MKKSLCKILPLLGILMMVAASCSLLNKTAKYDVTQGKVTYAIEYISIPEEFEAFKSMLPSELDMTFKGLKTKIVQNIPMMGQQVVLSEGDSLKDVVLMETMGRKIVLEVPEEERLKKTNTRSNASIEYIKEEKTIAGYECLKAIISTPDSDVPLTVYYAPSIVNARSEYLIPGMALQYDLIQSGMHMRFTAQNVEKLEISSTEFDVPEGYEKLSEEELKSVFPGM